MKHLFLFTIGPVQSFIAQARKTQDLYAGSKILSLLCQVGIQAAKDNGAERVIFPVVNTSSENASLPNRFIGVYTDSDNSSVKAFAEKVRDAIYVELNSLTSKFIINSSGISIPLQEVSNEIKDAFEVHWAFEPYAEGYLTAYKNLEKRLSAAKNTRIFQQLGDGNGEKGRKCNLNGERNVLFYRCNEKETYKSESHLKDLKLYHAAVEIFDFDDQSIIRLSEVSPGEGLSAISLLKRRTPYNGSSFFGINKFPSTTEIALLDVLNLKINSKNASETNEFKAFQRHFADKFDEELLYEDNLTTDYYKKLGLSFSKEEEEDIKLSHQKFRGIVEKEIGKKPIFNKYYALVVFDGDSMGKWLSGEYLVNPEDNILRFHTFLSEKLSDFAQSIERNCMPANQGRVVYAGGDDCLAFISLPNLFCVLQQLPVVFDERVNRPVQENFEIKNNEPLTLSAGIAIAHYREPLGDVLDHAKRMEKRIKDSRFGKNGFGIKILKHSGGQKEAAYKWSDSEGSLPEILNNTLNLTGEYFSRSLLKKIGSKLPVLKKEGKKNIPPQMAKAILKTLISRGYQGPKQTRVENQEKLIKLFNTLVLESKDTDNFIASVELIDFLNRQLYD